MQEVVYRLAVRSVLFQSELSSKVCPVRRPTSCGAPGTTLCLRLCTFETVFRNVWESQLCRDFFCDWRGNLFALDRILIRRLESFLLGSKHALAGICVKSGLQQLCPQLQVFVFSAPISHKSSHPKPLSWRVFSSRHPDLGNLGIDTGLGISLMILLFFLSFQFV